MKEIEIIKNFIANLKIVDLDDEIREIEKKLEILEIIEKHSDIHINSVVDNQLVIATQGLNCAYLDLSKKEIKKVKEWLENDK